MNCVAVTISQPPLLLPTQVQEHAFNTPFQLACPQILAASDRPHDGLTYSTRLMRGDVLVAGSDGLFDNMWDTQLAEVVAGVIRCVGNMSHIK